MRPLYFALTRAFCVAVVAVASSACGSNSDPETKNPETDALLQHEDDSSPGSSADGSGSCQLPDGARTFDELKGPPGNLAGDCVPSWTQEQLSSGFAAIRDKRLLTVPEQPEFLRRLPWLAADNGCEERAEAANYFFHQWGYSTPYFARVKAKRGKSLVFKTDNEPSGQVKWTGHVAPVVRVGGQLMVMDAAINPTRPLPIAEWLSQFSVADEIDVALCRDHELGDGCFEAAPVELPAPGTQPGGSMYVRLVTEWAVQEILGRDPYRTLGECPPWATCTEPEPTPDPSLPRRPDKVI